ncbi:hypothetical protein BT69DRAFT_8918 [Atractiella rhizophila]|nr:hypothetical protein BT69DRAFT_8918 [Atractiella rhizophila]
MDVETIVRTMFSHAEKNEWKEFLSYVDPNVRWWIAADEKDPINLTGVYDLQTWRQTVPAGLAPRVEGGTTAVSSKLLTLNVFGNLAIAEVAGSAKQKNGKPFNNRQAWFLVIDETSGKVKEIREYMNTALCREVMTTNDPGTA